MFLCTRGGQAKWVLSPQMTTFRCSEWSFINIYITDILLPHLLTSLHEFAGQVRAARSVAVKGTDAGPHLKTLYKEDSPIFKYTDILHTGFKIKLDIICMSHLYRTKQQIIDLPKWHDINCVLWNVHVIAFKVRISLTVFYSFLMVLVIWHLVLLMSCLYRLIQTAAYTDWGLICSDQVCFGGAALFTNCQA